MKAAVITAWVALTGPALAAGPQWTWEAGKQTNNGAITLKSTSGSTTYSGTQNPTGAVAKVNQTAVTQPPTVIIQATSGGASFNYKDDCWIFDVTGLANKLVIGAGKISSNEFTGMLTQLNGSYQSTILKVLAGGAVDSPWTWCGANVVCTWNNGGSTGHIYFYGGVVGVAALPILTYQKCYP